MNGFLVISQNRVTGYDQYIYMYTFPILGRQVYAYTNDCPGDKAFSFFLINVFAV